MIKSILLLLILPLLLIPSFAELQIYTEQGMDIIGVGKTLNIIITGAVDIVTITITSEFDEIIDTFSFVASDQGDINLPWIISKGLPFGIYIVNATDSFNSAETIYFYEEPIIEVPITVEETFELATNNKDELTIHNSTLSILTNTTDSNSIMLNNYNDTLAYYNSIMIQSNDMMYAQNNTITSLLNDISTLEESISILAEMVEELTSRVPPLPLDAPIIISVIADDPDNLDDIFSDGDTITILFDSETNVPLGDGTLTKQEVDDLFTFSEKIAQAYSGTWTNSSAFVISINSMANSALIINGTIVTPAQTILILSADNNQENYSHQTSPALIGDWGIP